MMALERCLHADAGLPCLCTDKVFFYLAAGDKGGRGGGSRAAVLVLRLREVMSFNAYRVHLEQMQSTEAGEF